VELAYPHAARQVFSIALPIGNKPASVVSAICQPLVVHDRSSAGCAFAHKGQAGIVDERNASTVDDDTGTRESDALARAGNTGRLIDRIGCRTDFELIVGRSLVERPAFD